MRVAETDAEAERIFSPYIDYLYNRCLLHIYAGFADAPGYRTLDTIKHGMLSQYGRPNMSGRLAGRNPLTAAISSRLAQDRARPSDRGAQSPALRQSDGAVAVRFDAVGSDGAKHRPVGAKVMPHLRGLWSEYQDRWSPHPLPQAERAKPAQVGAQTAPRAGAPRQAAAASEVAK